MLINKEVVEFCEEIQKSIEKKLFTKLTLSKPANNEQEIKNIYVRTVEIKETVMLSFTYRYQRKDVVKNYSIEEGLKLIQAAIGTTFFSGNLFTTTEDIEIKYNKKNVPKIFKSKPTLQVVASIAHDREKKRFIELKGNVYLQSLGIVDQRGELIKSMSHKYKQINKYIEIVDSLLKTSTITESFKIVDMGSGKGYLTFALHDYLLNSLKIEPVTQGVEFREELVKSCNNIAEKAGFQKLEFICTEINDYKPEKVDLLIALHACDTATDDAIYKGISSKADFIITAPCCHHQIRNQINCKSSFGDILQFGILKERQAQIITDGIRALLLEANGYKTKVFEFISAEHTDMNLMITATRTDDFSKKETILQKIEEIKEQFGIQQHYLEKLLNS